MRGEHLDVDALVSALAAPESDPRRAHLRTCARCQVAQQMYTEFMEEPADLTVSERTALETRLRTAILADSKLPTAGGAHQPKGGAAREAHGLDEIRTRRFRLWTRPTWAVAAALVLMGGFLAVRELRPDRQEIVLRDRSDPRGRNVVQLDAPRTIADGVIEIRWAPVPGAEAYQVRLYSAELVEIARFDASAELQLLLRPEDPALAKLPETVLLRVTALRDSSPLGTSRLATVRLR